MKKLGIDDPTLAKYIEKLGDRVALRNFCASSQQSFKKKSTRRTQLFEVLKSKLARTDNRTDRVSENEASTSTDERFECNAMGKLERKHTRRVEFGWIHNKKQVRKRQGGGTRKIDVVRSAKKKELLVLGKDIFFPNGLSTKGHISEFKFDILDFKEITLPDNITVADCYEIFKTGIVTFYLHTVTCDSDSECMPDDSQGTKCQNIGASTGRGNPVASTSAHSDDSVVCTTESTLISTVSQSDDGAACRVSTEYHKPSESTESDILSSAIDVVGSFVVGDVTLDVLSDSEIQFNFGMTSNSTSSVLEDTIPVTAFEMIIHRGPMAFTEICSNFMDPTILNKQINIGHILPNGDIEKAHDLGGVLKDTLTEFWEDFYSKCTVGRDVKVPCLRHDLGREEWKAIGRVLAFSWTTMGYWPIKLSKTFIHHCLFPELAIYNEQLLDDFYAFIAVQDKEIFQSALVDFSSVDYEDVIEALNTHDCRSRIKESNLLAVLLEIAGKEIIQTPTFVSDCWRDILQELCIANEKLDNIYAKLIPSNKGVLRMLLLPDFVNEHGNEVCKFLKRYVKELDNRKLRLFLRYCTGCDLLNVDKIAVELVPMTDFERRPIGHTCGCLLQLANQYDSFMEFRSEFDKVLESNIWVMDFA
ncbi:hypothetical protein HHUSO_G28534 [Huso huso]|uniref:HECT domain-containing protein n=1 Tax=Huso huso TaxID=61971 RepID=A0ABR0YKJ7_HUSHU